MNFKIKEALCYDDLMLTPKYSTIESRGDIDVSVKMNNLKFSSPIVTANMASVSGFDMVQAVAKNGGLGILHRFMSIEDQLEIAKKMIELKFTDNFAVSVGVKPIDKEYIIKFYDLGVRIVCIDIAHGDSQHCVEMIKYIRTNCPDMFVIAGNVATGGGARRLWLAGAHAVKGRCRWWFNLPH